MMCGQSKHILSNKRAYQNMQRLHAFTVSCLTKALLIDLAKYYNYSMYVLVTEKNFTEVTKKQVATILKI